MRNVCHGFLTLVKEYHMTQAISELQGYMANYIKTASSLLEKGLFIIGDSTYCIESFLLLPYDNNSPRTPEDDFNFYHSSPRITVECAFGEIDIRFFLKRLNCNLEHATIIIEGSMIIHNYLVNYRERNLNVNHLAADMDIFVKIF